MGEIPPPQQGAAPLADSNDATYSASVTGLAAAASCTDLFTIRNDSATKVTRVTKLRISGIKTTAGADIDVKLIKRSAANTGGTATDPAPTVVKHDSSNAAATAVVTAYTANPTVGTAVGDLASDKLWVGLATERTDVLEYTFGDRPSQAVRLRSTTELLAVNLNGATVGGGSFDITVEWSEK